LVHCMYELYGGDVSTQLLSSLTKVFTIFLQWEGFTLGVHDILVLAEADKTRAEIVRESRLVGRAATCQTLDIPEDVPDDELVEKLEEAYAKDPKFRANLDRKYKSTMDSYTNGINKTCLPAGLLCKFPDNNLQLMVMSGAKGSTVNTMQISCLLGQIELEGKRPPVMISGKSLPSFPIFECSPKSGGFIDGRFMTGIQPQDFFFHCMAGREGLIDTAVKTSRSGYLQRCLIKHLEGLTVSYDGTVRDSDNTVVQFMYGEDGMDILKSQFLKLKQMPFLLENRDAIVDNEVLETLRNSPEIHEKIQKIVKKVKIFKKRHGSTVQRQLRSEHRLIKKCPSTVTSQFPPNRYFSSISEAAEEILEKFMKGSDYDKDTVRDLMYVKSATSLADPGEPVGLIAAQSIGEPSTQMTVRFENLKQRSL
jgi:DNA-directed RNA polymerase I subunit RPA1